MTKHETLDFQQSFEPDRTEVDMSERRLVNTVFSTTVEDALLNHITDISSSGAQGSSMEMLPLTWPYAENSFISVTRIEQFGQATASIIIDRPRGDGRETTTYKQEPDPESPGEMMVVRYDAGDIVKKLKISQTLGQKSYLGFADQHPRSIDEIFELSARIDDRVFDREIDRVTGANSQPINFAEMQDLAAAVAASTPAEL